MIVFEDDEYVIHTARKHWIVFAMRFVLLLVIGTLPMLVVPFLQLVPNIPFEKTMLIFSYVYVLYLAGIWMVAFMMWTDYYLDIAVITNKRIIDMEQKGLFSRETSTMRYGTIQDVTVDVHGVIRTLLDFGDLSIQTAATTREFILNDIAQPNLAREIISRELSRVLEKSS